MKMQDSDRALDAARSAGKDTVCPAEYKAASDASDHAYDVFRACHTEEGVALAKKATEMANALCPPQQQQTQNVTPPVVEETPLVPPAPAEPKVGRMKYCVSLNIEFDIDKAAIRPEYHDEVAKVGDFMKSHPETSAIIEGYTDEVGSDDYNLKLSQRRAESVVKYLVSSFGIAPPRLSAMGYGKSKPIGDNSTDAGKQKNRHINATLDCALDVKGLPKPPDRLCLTLNIEYATDSAEIQHRFESDVDTVGEYMKKYPTTTALIEGHTDNTGSFEYNMKLSQRRAENVVNYLVNKFGIDRTRLKNVFTWYCCLVTHILFEIVSSGCQPVRHIKLTFAP